MSQDAPRYLLASATDASAVLRRLARAGWQTRESFALPEAGWDVTAGRLLLYGKVSDFDTAELALFAAVRGAGVVVIVDLATDVGRAFHADLARIGPVSTNPDDDGPADLATGPDPASGPQLIAEQRALLDRLANGETIAGAAQAEFLSLRTANRRIAEAREVLGVRTTREAVLAYLRTRRET